MGYGISPFTTVKPQAAYDIESPFMAGIKENMNTVIPLALKATELKFDEDKTNALMEMRKQTLGQEMEQAKRKTEVENAKMILEAAMQSKSQEAMGEYANRFKNLTGADLPSTETAIPGTYNRASAEDQLVPLTKKEYAIPQTDVEKKTALQELLYTLKGQNLEQLYGLKTDLLKENLAGQRDKQFLAALLKGLGVGDGSKPGDFPGMPGYKLSQVVDDTRQHYGAKIAALKDPITGGIMKGKEQEYQDIMADMQRDTTWAIGGNKPRWMTGARSITPLVRFLGQAQSEADVKKLLVEGKQKGWTKDELAYALDELQIWKNINPGAK